MRSVRTIPRELGHLVAKRCLVRLAQLVPPAQKRAPCERQGAMANTGTHPKLKIMYFPGCAALSHALRSLMLLRFLDFSVALSEGEPIAANYEKNT